MKCQKITSDINSNNWNYILAHNYYISIYLFCNFNKIVAKNLNLCFIKVFWLNMQK